MLPHFTDDETEGLENLSDSPEVTRLVGLRTSACKPILKPYGRLFGSFF